MATKRLRQKVSISVSSSRWAAYTAAGIASGVGFVSQATEADGAIIYMNVNQRVDASPGSFVSFGFTLAGNAANQIYFSHGRDPSPNSGYGGGFFGIKAAVSAGFIGLSANGYRYVGKLAFGDTINGGAFLNFNDPAFHFGTLALRSGYTNSRWQSAGTGYVGFKFNTGAGVQFGWARITVDGTNGNAFTVLDFAYAGVGESITAGQVPEPGSLAILALGGGGLLLWRIRRAKATASA